MGPWYYEVVSFDGDYVNLRRTDIASDELNPVALALLPSNTRSSAERRRTPGVQIVRSGRPFLLFSCGSSGPARRASPHTGAGPPPHCG